MSEDHQQPTINLDVVVQSARLEGAYMAGLVIIEEALRRWTVHGSGVDLATQVRLGLVAAGLMPPVDTKDFIPPSVD